MKKPIIAMLSLVLLLVMTSVPTNAAQLKSEPKDYKCSSQQNHHKFDANKFLKHALEKKIITKEHHDAILKKFADEPNLTHKQKHAYIKKFFKDHKIELHNKHKRHNKHHKKHHGRKHSKRHGRGHKRGHGHRRGHRGHRRH